MAYKKQKLLAKRKALFVAQVLQETGEMNLTEAHRRMYPGQKDICHFGHCHDMLKGRAMEEFEKLLKLRDKDLLKKITPEVIVQDLVADLELLSERLHSKEISVEDVVKILNAKGIKQKLLGQAIGMWKSEKPVEREETAGEILNKLREGSLN